ncbi:MAG: hypothetical protein DHS20C21_05150 [Gemmatimonadota bacterium]|nr:MAG: hypothetical protein DHS20C21_05150 [Gemmatimonadota bacterium]
MSPTPRCVPWLLSALPILAALTGCGEETTGPGGNPSREVPVFGVNLVEPSEVSMIVPTGSISGDEIKGHAFVRFDGASIAIHAPHEMVLTSATWVGASNDFGFQFDINARFRFRLGHIDEPRADIAALVPRDDPSSLFTNVGPVLILAGELIGYATGSGGGDGFDVGVYDLDQENLTPNADRYRQTQDWEKLNSACPFAYFDDSLRGEYEARFGTIGGVLVPGAPCRTISDVAGGGGVAGEWYLTSHAPDGTYRERFAIGQDLAGAAVRVAGIEGTHDFIAATDPQAVEDEVCYGGGGVFIFIRKTSPTTADAVFGTGDCPGSFPAGEFRSYER